MKASLVTLKLILDELGVDPSIEKLAERKTIQKAIYLAQAVGIDLGYSYGWYVRGPYSPKLTRDYYALDEVLLAGSFESDTKLRRGVADRLGSLENLFAVPADVDLPDHGWLELLASLRYLRTERRLSENEAREVIAKEKEGLLPYVDQGARALASAGL